jgi:hypothetical protein
MATSLQNAVRVSTVNLITTAAGTTAYLYVYTGSAPAKVSNAFVAPTGTLLALFALANPIGPTGVVGVLTLTPPSNVTASASGTPGYYRIGTAATDTNGSGCIVQGSSGVGSGDLNFASTIASGGTCGITSFTYTEGNP